MKKVLLIVFLLLVSNLTYSQKFEKVKALKTAFITDRLELTVAEAEKFWPVYNRYEKELHQFQVVERMEIFDTLVESGGAKNLTEKEASEILQKILNLKQKIQTTENNKYLALKTVIPSIKILKLIKVEESFKKELFKLLQEQKGKK